MNIKIIKYYLNNIDSKLYFLFLIMLIGGGLEVFGVGLFIPLLTEEETSFSLAIESVLNFFRFDFNNLNLSFFILTVFIVKFLVINLQNFYIYRVSYNFMYKIKRNLMEKVSKVDFVIYGTLGIDSLNNIFSKEVEKCALSIRYFLQLGVNLIHSLLYLVFSLFVNYKIVVVSLLIAFLVVLLQRKITKLIISYSKKVVEGNTKANLIVLQILENMKYIKSTNSYKYNDTLFNEVSRQYSTNLEKVSFFNSIPKNTPELVGVFIISTIIIINELTLKENVFTVVFLGLILYRVLVKVLSIQKSYQDFLVNIGAIEKVLEIDGYLSSESDILDSDSCQVINCIKKIEIKNAFFSIDEKTLVNGISLNLNAGKIYAIVGRTGSGKSSLLNILTYLYKIEYGNMLINDKKDIDVIAYRRKIGYVSQEPVIFEASIKENILLGRDFESDKYFEIVKSLGIDCFKIEKLTLGGGNISGGQRQLISLARELYKDPDVLILDEFTSALDSDTERKVIQYIENIKKDKIVIIVAHRLSSIRNSDCVYLLEDGQIIDFDIFDALYYKSEIFKSMCKNQNILLGN